MYVDPLSDRYPTRESLLQFYDEVARETAAIPGVASVAWTSDLPLTAGDGRDVSFEIVGDPAVDERRRPAADSHIVSPTYFDAIDLPIVAGRALRLIATPPTARRCAWSTKHSCAVTCKDGRRSACRSRCGPPSSPRAAPAVCRDRRRRPPGPRPPGRTRSVRPGLPADRAAAQRRHLSGGSRRHGRSRGADVGGARRDRTGRSRPAGRRARHHGRSRTSPGPRRSATGSAPSSWSPSPASR